MTVAVVSPNERDLSKFAFVLGQLAQGRSNAVGSFTLATNVASTVVTAVTCGTGSSPLLIPTSSTAAAELGNGTLWVSSVLAQSFTVNHASNSVATRTFLYAILG